MEKNERYDPEDIERLLHERSYDELLMEERAYVERHLSGRDEYERMRALLLGMRRTGYDQPDIRADEEIRTHVLSIYRQHHPSRWRVWLNSVGSIFPPRQHGSEWRPILALGAAALLVMGSILLIRQLENKASVPLAEVRKEVGQANEREQSSTAQPLAGMIDDPEQELLPTDKESERSAVSVLEDLPRPVRPSETPEAVDKAAEKEALRRDVLYDVEVAELKDERFYVQDEAPAARQDFSRVVTADELVRNQSLANASGGVRVADTSTLEQKATERKADRARTLAQDAEILQLVAAGW